MASFVEHPFQCRKKFHNLVILNSSLLHFFSPCDYIMMMMMIIIIIIIMMIYA